MTVGRDQKRQEAIKALINIALLEGAVLIVVVASYMMTRSLIVLIAGLIGSTLIFAPMFLRWAQARQDTAKPNSAGGGDE